MRKFLLFRWMLISVIFFTGVARGNPLSRFSDDDNKKLSRGEVVFKYKEISEPGEKVEGAGTAYVIINSPVEQCFRIFTQFEKHYEWLPTLCAGDVLERRGDGLIMHNVADFKIMKIHYTINVTVDPKAYRAHFVTFPEGKNDIKFIQGIYLFEKIDDKRTLFTFTIVKLDIGLKVPAPVKEYFATRDLPDVAINMKKRIESGGVWKKK